MLYSDLFQITTKVRRKNYSFKGSGKKIRFLFQFFRWFFRFFSSRVEKFIGKVPKVLYYGGILSVLKLIVLWYDFLTLARYLFSSL